jgi:hypothetical protein
MVLSLSRPLLDVLASAMGIFYPPSALFVVAMIFILIILLHFSTVITRLTQENKEIAQQVALLRYEIAQLSTNRQRDNGQHKHQTNQVE